MISAQVVKAGRVGTLNNVIVCILCHSTLAFWNEILPEICVTLPPPHPYGCCPMPWVREDGIPLLDELLYKFFIE